MALDLVLNDLSLTPAADVLVARSRMTDLVQTLRSAMLHGTKGVLRTQSGFRGLVLADGYPFDRWANDGYVDRDARFFLLQLTTKAPYCQDHAALEDRVRGVECRFSGCAALGLGVAHLLDTLAVSLASDPIWDAWQLWLQCEELREGAEIACSTEQVHHACFPDHVIRNALWIKERLRGDVRSGRELWERRDELLPSLQFCDSVKHQLEELIPLLVPAVARHLFALDSYCRDWTAGGFNPSEIPLTISMESEPTLAQYGLERTFTCPDGVSRLFNWHSKGTPGPFRIHFVPAGPGELIIGYVGRHLRTVRSN